MQSLKRDAAEFEGSLRDLISSWLRHAGSHELLACELQLCSIHKNTNMQNNVHIVDNYKKLVDDTALYLTN